MIKSVQPIEQLNNVNIIKICVYYKTKSTAETDRNVIPFAGICHIPKQGYNKFDNFIIVNQTFFWFNFCC